jgi:hypothetical protein
MLTLPANQPPERPQPTAIQTMAALSALPEGFGAMGTALLASAGVTADHLLRFAEAMRAGARERRGLFPHGDAETRAMERLAGILEDAAWRYPTPPRVPLTAIEADVAVRRYAAAAGLSTAGGSS